MPLFSVIIPTYGRPDYLTEAIDSVLTQTIADFECIVVDDASPEPISVPNDSRIRLIRRVKNGGPAAARNTGLEQACGKFVAFLDDDDVFTPNRLALALRGLERAPISLCWARHFDERPSAGQDLQGLVPEKLLAHTTPHLNATALSLDIAEPLDISYAAAEDVEWWTRMAPRHPVATITEVGALIRRHTGDRVGYGARERRDAMVRVLGQHPDIFRSYPKAHAFRWKRVGLASLAINDYPMARRAFWAALRIRPEARTFVHLVRSACQ